MRAADTLAFSPDGFGGVIVDSEQLPAGVQEFQTALVSAFNKRIVRAALDSPGVTPEWIDGYADPARYEFFMPP